MELLSVDFIYDSPFDDLIKSHLIHLYKTLPLNNNSLFIALINKKIVIDDYIKIQSSFIYIIHHWIKLYGLLLTKVPKISQCILISNNLSDSLGNDSEDSSHIVNYFKYLKKIGFKEDYPKCCPQTKFLLDILYSIDDYTVLCSAMAAIEVVYISYSKFCIYIEMASNLNCSKPNNNINEFKHPINLLKIAMSEKKNISSDKISIGLTLGYELFFRMNESYIKPNYQLITEISIYKTENKEYNDDDFIIKSLILL